jgi:hypothetical protein
LPPISRNKNNLGVHVMETKDPEIFESPALVLKSKPNELDIKS